MVGWVELGGEWDDVGGFGGGKVVGEVRLGVEVEGGVGLVGEG